MTGTTPADIEALCGLRSDPAQAGRMTQKRPRVARTAPTALEQKLLRLLMRYPALAARLDADARAQLTAPELPQGEVLAGLLAECDAASPEMHFGAFVERLGQTPYAEAFAGLRVTVLEDDIELEPATMEFDSAVQKMLLASHKRELEMLLRKVESGHASDDDRERMRWLLSETSRR